MDFNNVNGTNKSFIIQVYTLHLYTSIKSAKTTSETNALPTSFPTAAYKIVGNIHPGIGSGCVLRCHNYSSTNFVCEIRNGTSGTITDIVMDFIIIGAFSNSI